MNRQQTTFLLAGLLSLTSGFSDHPYSQSRDERHEEMREHLDRGSNEKSSGWFRKNKSQDSSKDEPFFRRKYMTGNWDGARTKLAQHGWTISSTYATDVQWNVDGGLDRGYGSCGSLGIDINVDFDRLAHIPGFSFNVGFVARSGVNLTERKIGNQFPVGQIYGSETYQLNNLYFQQTAFDGAFLFKAGRMNAGDDFLQSNSYQKFVNNAFCGNPIAIFFNTPFSAYPNATWGAFLHVKPSASMVWKFAVYNGNTERKLNKFHGTNFRFTSDAGAIGLTELDWMFGDEPNSWWYPGVYKLGVYGVSQKAAKFDAGEGYNYGTYLQFDQMLYMPDAKNKQRGLTAFGSALFSPKDRNEFPFFFTTGLIYQGLFKSRSQDALCIGFARGGYSSVMRQIQMNAASGGPTTFGTVPQHFEAALEANYWFYISKWWYVAPDYQYIMNPKGFGTIKNAHVVGLQTGVTF